MEIYLIRHTAVDVPAGVCYGQTDVPLKDSFEQEAQLVKQQIEGIDFDIAFSSPLSRCTRLATYCGFENAELNSSIKELDFGDWEMRKWEDVDTSVWDVDWINNAPLYGESFAEMYDRVAAFFDGLKKREYNRIAIFAHGGVVACAKVYFNGIAVDKAFEVKVDYGEISRFTL